MKKVLMVAFHFPPAAMGSGHLRTLGFARHLPSFGWEPIVLSARACAYPFTAPLVDGVIPSGCAVRRAMAFDACRHFAIAGKYPGFIAQPDRWVSWWPAAVWQGLRLIRRHRIDAIWSTYPIMTAHCVARTLSRLTHLPWIADFRDPVSGSVSAVNQLAVASQHRWERRVLRDATRTVFTTPGALRDYAERYPEVHHQGRLGVVGNGYDETAFSGLPQAPPSPTGRPLVLLHSGLLYSEGRNPAPFLTALAHLKTAGQTSAEKLRVVFRGSGFTTTYTRVIQGLGLEDMVVLGPLVPNREALIEQAQADALLLFQGSKFDRQIPAKVYEYLRVGRPIFALVAPGGDTAALLRTTGGAELVPTDDVAEIERGLAEFIVALRDGRPPIAAPEIVQQYSRRRGAALLAAMLDDATGQRSAANAPPVMNNRPAPARGRDGVEQTS